MRNQLSPIALFAYNRPALLNLCIESLLKNDEAKDSNLYVFSDGPKLNADSSEIENGDFFNTGENITSQHQTVLADQLWC